MQIILTGNLPIPLPQKMQLKQVIFSVHISTTQGAEIDHCTLQFYHSQSFYPSFERKYERDTSQPIKNLLFDVDETEFTLTADMCRVTAPILQPDDEVFIIPIF